MLLKLFTTMFVLSSCTFGGGFVIVSLMKKKIVEEYGWLSEEEMLDITAIAQSCPGPVVVNTSVITGYRLAGVAGSAAALLGAILPPMIIISIIAQFYEQFRTNAVIALALTVMRAGVAAVLVDVVIGMAWSVLKTKNLLYIVLMAVTFFMGTVLDIGAMYIIFSCLGVGIAVAVYQSLRQARKAV
ncbi:MAG: chromate transporter [Clostridiales bacterium]|nr:chromate transporter [Clostridiales bacterium]